MSKYVILSLAILLSAYTLGRAYTYKYRAEDKVVVTGLGEQTFESDLIVWNATLTYETTNAASGYEHLNRNRQIVSEFLNAKGVDAAEVTYSFVNVEKTYESVYNPNGSWAGERFTGYRLRQDIRIESRAVELIDRTSREISALIAQGVSIEASAPQFYYTKLDDVKLDLIETASANARRRAEKIAENAGTEIGAVASARMGVFQITGANTNEEFTAGGSFNTQSRTKKARITMRIEYRVN